MLPLEWCSAIAFYSVETLVLIEGDASAPFSRQLLELQVLLQNWVPMAEQLDSMLSSKSQQKHKEKIYGSWQDEFYPYTIVPAVLYSDSWEIVFYRNSGVNYNFTVFGKKTKYKIYIWEVFIYSISRSFFVKLLTTIS